LGPGAVVPWNLYGLKIAKRNGHCNRLCANSGSPPFSPRNHDCFFTRFVVKRQAYGAKRIGAFHGHPQKRERASRDFSLGRGVFRSLERPKSESASRERRDASRAGARESECANGFNKWSATTGQNR